MIERGSGEMKFIGGFAVLALLFVWGPGWLRGASRGDELARATLKNADVAQSIEFAKSSPPTYVTCDGHDCERQLHLDLPPGVYLWMEAGDGTFVARAIHEASDSVWVRDSTARDVRSEPSTPAQRAARDAFLAQH